MESQIIKTKIPGWASEKEARELLNLKQTALWKLRKSGTIKFSKIGGHTYYNVQSIMDLLDKNSI